jgi:predicted RNase H-related nuclease YkuK (DUF458 family)
MHVSKSEVKMSTEEINEYVKLAKFITYFFSLNFGSDKRSKKEGTKFLCSLRYALKESISPFSK